MSAPARTWISLGRRGCRGNTLTLTEPGGVRRTTCSKCSLEYTEPIAGASS